MTALPLHHRVWRMVRLRKRLAASTLIGLAVWFLLPIEQRPSTRGLIGWNVGATLYLVASWVQMLRADVASLRRRAAKEDEAGWIVLALTIVAALVSVAAIGIELHVSGPGDEKPPLSHLGLAGLTIAISWAFIHTVITLHYAHLFYGAGSRPAGGLDFPKTAEPDYLDFLYFSFTIGAAAQTSDVAVTNHTMRRMVLVQTILAFLFNTTILALAINIGASLI